LFLRGKFKQKKEGGINYKGGEGGAEQILVPCQEMMRILTEARGFSQRSVGEGKVWNLKKEANSQIVFGPAVGGPNIPSDDLQRRATERGKKKLKRKVSITTKKGSRFASAKGGIAVARKRIGLSCPEKARQKIEGWNASHLR